MKQKMQCAMLSVVVLTVVSWLSACQNGGNAAKGRWAADARFEQFESHINTPKCEVGCVVSYPVDGTNDALIEAAREWINEMLGGSYVGDLTDGQAVVDYYAEAFQKEVDFEVPETDDEESDWLADVASIRSDSIYVFYECDEYVTLMSDGYIYYAGAAHGFGGFLGVTLRRSDGCRITWDMFKESDSDLFQSVLEDGLREYFELDDTDDLADCLLLYDTDNNGELPLPATPILTADGVKFIYQQYEIAPYSAGNPSFVVSYERMKPLMKTALRRLVGCE